MALNEILKQQREFSEILDKLCRRPTATTEKQLNKWQENNIEYLKAKQKNIETMSKELESDIDVVFQEHKKYYYRVVENWHERGYKDSQKWNLLYMKKAGEITQEKMIVEVEKIEKLDMSNVNTDEQIDRFFSIFEDIINAIKKEKRWLDIYKASNLMGQGLVSNMSSLDLFAWQLPSADLRDKNDYKKIAKIMTVLFFIEKIHKNKNSMTNETNPYDKIMNLDKIVSYYYLAKEK